MRPWTSISRTAASAVLFVMIAGCGPARGTLSGKVTHKDKSVVWGSVSAIGSDGIQYDGKITPEGTYAIGGVTGGPIKLCVTSPNPAANRPGGSRSAVGDRKEGAVASPSIP